MKSKILLFLTIFNCSFSQIEYHKAKFTIKVIGEDQLPIPEARLKIKAFEISEKFEAVIHDVKTDNEGRYTYENRVSQDIVVAIEKLNYYRRGAGQNFIGIENGQWIPFGKETVVTLAKIINPVPMYAVNHWEAELPQASSAGFDLEKHDWVAPYGKGLTPDMVFSLEKSGNEKNGEAKLKMVFANQGDGIIPINELPPSRLLREGPAQGYLPEYFWKDEWKSFERDSVGLRGI
jgi:hypothetical protein